MFNRLIFWISLGFLIYVLAMERFGNKTPQTTIPANTQAEAPPQTPATQSLVTNAIDNIIRPVTQGRLPLAIDIGPHIAMEPQHINDTKPGTGNVALCGSHVKVRYALNRVNLPDEATEFVVGERSVFPGLESAVMGMKVRGVRKVDLPPALAYNNMALSKDPYTSSHLVPLEVELLSATPDVSYEPYAMQVFVKDLGEGDMAKCFDTVRVQYSVRTFEGKILADTEAKKLTPLAVTLGSGKAPLGVEQALVGIKEGGTRTAIIFPEAMKRLKEEGKIMLEGESGYPKSGLIFEFKRMPNT